MSINQPLVSVVIPAYCAAKYLAKTIESVLAQTYGNIEVIVVDDGSTDRTHQIATRFAVHDRRITVLRQENKGVAAARNLGIARASGEFIAPIDADDIWLPENLEKQVAKIQASGEDCGVVYSWSFDIDETDKPLGTFHAYKIENSVSTTLLCHNFLGNASCTLIRASSLKDVGLYSLEFKELGLQGCEDWELYARISEKYRFKVVPEFLVAYRRSQHSMSQSCNSMAASHSLVLRSAQRRAPLPMPIRRLSTSSFYVHLAHQSAESNRHSETLDWLLRAIRAECLTPLLRAETYTLLTRALMKKPSRPAAAPIDESDEPAALRAFEARPVRLYWRQALGSLIHAYLELMFEGKRKQATRANRRLTNRQGPPVASR